MGNYASRHDGAAFIIGAVQYICLIHTILYQNMLHAHVILNIPPGDRPYANNKKRRDRVSL